MNAMLVMQWLGVDAFLIHKGNLSLELATNVALVPTLERSL